MATGTLLTIDDFERLASETEKNCELVEGELVELPSNTPRHNGMRDFLIALLLPFVGARKLGKLYAELGYDFLGNVHCPDVGFFGPTKLPLLELDKHVQRFVPDLAIEIASPSDTYEGLPKKKDRYLAAGTAEVWLISIETREVAICSTESRLILRGSDVLSTPRIPGFSITLDKLFA